MLDADTLIEKHRGKGVFVDTNLFVLLLVGSVNTRRIRDFKRTQDFTVEDFRTLSALVDWFGTPLVTTPRVLSQVSDLTDLSGREAAVIRQVFKTTIELAQETYDTAKQLVQHLLFERFGLGDAPVASVCARDVVVLTADVQLQIALGCLGLDAINFNHVRARGWRHSNA
jgi:hypothetical protein